MFSIAILATIAQLFLAVPVRSADQCVCLPGSSCWPSAVDWNSFNTTVNGTLVAVYPVATPCHNPSYNAAECEQVATQFTNSSWRADQIGSIPT
jgi:hypothetical protein